MSVTAGWFDVDREGLAKVLERRGKEFIVFELISNCLDTAAKVVTVDLRKHDGKPSATIRIEDDDPDGFQNLTHAYTLFAGSNRKGDQSKRGRFNFGEKIVLAGCREATIETTTGTVVFDKDGRRIKRAKRANGSVFSAELRMNYGEYAASCAAAKRILPPPGVTITFNGEEIPHRVPVTTIRDVSLPTVIPDEEGFLKRTYRDTELAVYEPLDGEAAMLYELGIPVVDTGDRWHVDVRQKVPVNLDRDNVDPSYLRDVRVAVVNALADRLTAADAATPLTSEALSDSDVNAQAVSRVLDLRYGEKRAIFDPSDTEANNRLVAEGYTLIHGGHLTADQWQNVRRHGAAKPSGQIRPTARAQFSPDGVDYWIKDEDLTYGMRRVQKYARMVAPELIGRDVAVSFLDAPKGTFPFAASFGAQGLVFNAGVLGHEWFDKIPWLDIEVNELLIHELAHAVEPNHLSDKYHEACCRIGAKLAKLYIEKTALVLS